MNNYVHSNEWPFNHRAALRYFIYACVDITIIIIFQQSDIADFAMLSTLPLA